MSFANSDVYTTHRWGDTAHTSEPSFGTESSSIKSARASLSRLLSGKTSHTNGRYGSSGSALDTQTSHMNNLDNGKKNSDK